MADTPIVHVDRDAVNERILAKEVKADFRRVEAASVKMVTYFTSAEAKRLFVRFFSTLQLNVHFISVIARTKLKHEDVEQVEATLRELLEALAGNLNTAIDGAEVLFKNNGITRFATYDTQPLELEVGISSPSGRRYFEVLGKFDQLMPLLQTLEIHELITLRDADLQRASLKREIRSIAIRARNLATGLRRRMNEFSGKEAWREQSKSARPPGLIFTVKSQEHPGGAVEGAAPAGIEALDLKVTSPEGILAADGELSLHDGEKIPLRKADASQAQSETLARIER